MRPTDRLHEAGLGDDYTPATDLVFSMLALTLLLLAIFGAGSHVTETRSFSTLEEMENEIAGLTAELAELGTDRTRLIEESARAEAKLAEARERIRRLEADIAALSSPKPGPTDTNVARLTRELEVLRRQYAEKTRQYEAIMDELTEAQKLARPEFRLSPISAETFGDFLDADDRIAAPVLGEVVRGLRAAREQVSERRLNEVVIQIETGHVPGKSTPDGPDNESLETFMIGSALQRGLWGTQLPPACVVIEPFGRVRASGLVDRMVVPGAGQLMESLTTKGGALDGAELRQRTDRLSVKDRRIFVTLRRVEKSPCTAEALRRALDAP